MQAGAFAILLAACQSIHLALWGHIWGFPKIRVPLKVLPYGYYKGSFKGRYKGLEFRKIRGTLFWGSLIMIRILLFRVLYSGSLFSETPISLHVCVNESAIM